MKNVIERIDLTRRTSTEVAADGKPSFTVLYGCDIHASTTVAEANLDELSLRDLKLLRDALVRFIIRETREGGEA